MSASVRGEGTVTIDAIDLSKPALFRRGFPHEVFSALRREAPVWWHPPPENTDFGGRGFWVLSRYDDIQSANRDTDLFSALEGPSLLSPKEIKGTMMVAMDGAPHTRLRKLISAGFTPRMISRLEDQARSWAVSIVEAALERGTCEFVNEVAYQLPMHMIADIVGIPVEDRAWLFSKTNDFLQASDPEYPVSQAEQRAIEIEMFQYAQKLGEEKRKNPQDDIWTILQTVEVESNGGERSGLSQIELDMFFLLLTVAGSETTRNAIALGLLALLENPDQLASLRHDPTRMRSATEEILRWSSPVAYFRRAATRDTEIRGVPIQAGDGLTLWYPSGNRDEAIFDTPFRFDIARSPNHQQAFGAGGPHFCLGANLARFEISILFEELLARTADIELLGDVTYNVQGLGNPIIVSAKELPVRLKPR